MSIDCHNDPNGTLYINEWEGCVWMKLRNESPKLTTFVGWGTDRGDVARIGVATNLSSKYAVHIVIKPNG